MPNSTHYYNDLSVLVFNPQGFKLQVNRRGGRGGFWLQGAEDCFVEIMTRLAACMTLKLETAMITGHLRFCSMTNITPQCQTPYMSRCISHRYILTCYTLWHGMLFLRYHGSSHLHRLHSPTQALFTAPSNYRGSDDSFSILSLLIYGGETRR